MIADHLSRLEMIAKKEKKTEIAENFLYGAAVFVVRSNTIVC